MASLLFEYIWLDGNKPQQIRSKIKLVDGVRITEELAEFEKTEDPSYLPVWNFDGSSTNQAEGHSSDCLLVPVKVFPHPFYSPGYAVLCEVKDTADQPHKSNTRFSLANSEEMYDDQEPLFGIEQEYVLLDEKYGQPLGFKWENGVNKTKAQGDYYCGSGTENAFGRKIAEEHMNTCIAIGLDICGINAEVMPGQWEFQVGPLSALEVSDQLWLARWILLRVAERHGVTVSFDPKPVQEGDWNGSGCHTNFSTASMRQPGGMKAISEAIVRLNEKHAEHMKAYGVGNELRMTGKHETCDYNTFRVGNSDRGASVRIPINVKLKGYGYFEDRRPAANMDPYEVCYLLLRTICSN